jgi:leucyl aminopeptidase
MVLADCLSHCREKALTGACPRSLLLVTFPVPKLIHYPNLVKGVVPRLMTVCTLTGHAALSVGPYGITLDNSVAKKDRQSYALQDHGEVWGDPLEVTQLLFFLSRTLSVIACIGCLTVVCACVQVTSLRREDVAFVAAKNKTFDLLQCNTAPSSGTPRGHQVRRLGCFDPDSETHTHLHVLFVKQQFPVAFIIKASGLDKHGVHSQQPLVRGHQSR